MARGQETVFTPEQTAALGLMANSGGGAPRELVIEQLVIHEDGRVDVRFEGHDFEAAVKRVVRDTGLGRGLAATGPR